MRSIPFDKTPSRLSSSSLDEKASHDFPSFKIEAKHAPNTAFKAVEHKAQLQPAVAKVEALYSVFGGRGSTTIWLLYVCIGLVSLSRNRFGSYVLILCQAQLH